MLQAPLTLWIMQEEQFRAHVYDDATGKPIGPGSTLIGHPTVGYGIALDVGAITEPEAAQLLANRLGTLAMVMRQRSWFGRLDAVRQDAIIAMAYQMGPGGVDSFHGLIAALEAGMWEAAAAGALASLWARQTPARAMRVATMLRTGLYPPARA